MYILPMLDVIFYNCAGCQPNGQAPVSSTDKRITLEVVDDGQPLNCPTPRKLALEEIPKIDNDFRLAARNAIDAGKLIWS